MADIVKCANPADPHRCQATIAKSGQCLNMAAKDEQGRYSKYCLAHGGNVDLETQRNESMRNYRLNKFKARIYEKADAPAIKSLRDEIAILRVILEERLNRCTDGMDLIMQSGPISDLVGKIERVVVSCHKLDGSMGQLLDKSAILQFAGEIIDIIGEVVTDSALLEEIGNRIMVAVGRVGENNESF